MPLITIVVKTIIVGRYFVLGSIAIDGIKPSPDAWRTGSRDKVRSLVFDAFQRDIFPENSVTKGKVVSIEIPVLNPDHTVDQAGCRGYLRVAVGIDFKPSAAILLAPIKS